MTADYQETNVLLRIENVSLQFGEKMVLRDVNVEVRNLTRPGCTTGQVIGFLGPSGIGKTQLFRIMAGLTRPSAGRVVINDLDRDVHAGEVGVVAQNYPLLEHRTILGNLMLAAQQKEANYHAAKNTVCAYLDRFELLDKASLYPAQLSGGQRQRCAIIQQLLCSDHFLLMDEPFSGLDIVMEEKVLQLIGEIAGMDDLNTVIVVTHDVSAAAAVADHLWMLGRDRDAAGNVVAGAKIQRVYNLIERDLCWHPGITGTPQFTEFVREVKEYFRTL